MIERERERERGRKRVVSRRTHQLLLSMKLNIVSASQPKKKQNEKKERKNGRMKEIRLGGTQVFAMAFLLFSEP